MEKQHSEKKTPDLFELSNTDFNTIPDGCINDSQI